MTVGRAGIWIGDTPLRPLHQIDDEHAQIGGDRPAPLGSTTEDRKGYKCVEDLILPRPIGTEKVV
jgi:hypothetical protein